MNLSDTYDTAFRVDGGAILLRAVFTTWQDIGRAFIDAMDATTYRRNEKCVPNKCSETTADLSLIECSIMMISYRENEKLEHD